MATTSDRQDQFGRDAVEPAGTFFVLRLYVSGASPKSLEAIKNVKTICDEHLVGRYQLDVVAYVEPKPGSQPTAQHTVEVINIALQRNVKIILMENFYDRRAPDQIAAHSKARVVFVPSMVGGEERVKTYFDLFDVVIGERAKAGGSP